MSNKYIKNIITNKLEWGKYVSAFSDRNLAPYNWYAFKHRFGSELVTKLFSSFGLQKGDTILDPFCGGGTTLIKAKFDGYNAFGLDISPFSVFLSNVLTQTCDPIRLKSSLNKISHKVNPRVEIPDVAILTKSFSEPTLKYIYSLRDSINLLSSTERKFYLFTLLSILNGISKAKKAGGFLRITDQRKIPLNIVRTKFQQAAEKLIDEVENFQYSDSTVLAIRGDARKYPAKIKNRKYDAILTSPPYPNRHDYTRIYELELLVGFIEDNNSLKSLRYKTLRSHVEAKEKYKAIVEPIFEADFCAGSYGYRPRRTAHQAVARVAEAIVRNKTRVLDVDLAAYFDRVRHDLL